MNHEPRRDQLLDLALGLLEPAEARALEAHAAGCAACRDELASLRRTHQLVTSLPPVEAPERGVAVLLAAARQAAASVEARRPGWGMPRWLAGGALGLAGAAALAVLVLRVPGPPSGGPLSDEREPLLGQVAPPPEPAAIPVEATGEAKTGSGSGAAPASSAPPPARAVGIARSAEAGAARGAMAPAGEGRKESKADLYETAPPIAAPTTAPTAPPTETPTAAPTALPTAAPTAAPTETPATPQAVAPAGERRKEARAALAEAPVVASRAAVFAAKVADEAGPPCRLEQRRRLTRDAEGRVIGRVREGLYPEAGGEVSLRVEERFGADGRLQGGTVRVGERQFTVGVGELAAGRLEPLPGVVLARSAAEAELAAPRCEP